MPGQDCAGLSKLKLVAYMVYSKIIQAGSNYDQFGSYYAFVPRAICSCYGSHCNTNSVRKSDCTGRSRISGNGVHMYKGVGGCCALFDLILYVQSTIFQLNRDGSSWVKPVLS